MLKSKKEAMQDVGRVRNRKVEIIAYQSGTDEDGFPVENQEVLFKTVWMSVRGLRGKEFYQANQVQAQDDKIFNCRYFEGLTTDMIIKYDGSPYNITSINNLNERNFEYEIHAKEVTSSE